MLSNCSFVSGRAATLYGRRGHTGRYSGDSGGGEAPSLVGSTSPLAFCLPAAFPALSSCAEDSAIASVDPEPLVVTPDVVRNCSYVRSGSPAREVSSLAFLAGRSVTWTSFNSSIFLFFTPDPTPSQLSALSLSACNAAASSSSLRILYATSLSPSPPPPSPTPPSSP